MVVPPLVVAGEREEVVMALALFPSFGFKPEFEPAPVLVSWFEVRGGDDETTVPIAAPPALAWAWVEEEKAELKCCVCECV